MSGSVHEQHLLHHDLGDGPHLRQSHAGELQRIGSTVGGEVQQNPNHIVIAGDDPGMQVGVPMYRVFSAELAVQRIRVGQDRWIQQVVQTENSALAWNRWRGLLGSRHAGSPPPSLWASSRSKSSGLIASILAKMSRSISADSPAIVG